MSEPQFRQQVGDAPFLVIRVADDGHLLSGLERTIPSGNPLVAPRDEPEAPTVTRGSTASLIARALLRRRRFERELARATHFVAPLRKREGIDAAHAERIVVGRSVTSDIVLRQSGVSKLHAWFERDEEGTYYVRDAGSKNRTVVNGEVLDTRAPFPIKDGDAVVFGGVSAFFCRPPRVRDLVRSGPYVPPHAD
jgi:hypothetical protein